ncbi:unnamed protein product [Caenorhabditis angaria]|uniref:Uncharacterized protein n=1 Tax=Caenorhabditis angaria TaxID=860376 RepID=A0A9P1N8R3_9PELO|nr:unnamed protein product [Caenorhabditis angaria]
MRFMLLLSISIIFAIFDNFIVCSFLLQPKAKIQQLGERHWQLYNRCSRGMLQTYLSHLNANGIEDQYCLTDWNVIGEWGGKFRLQHARTRKFLCFNKRARITLRYDGEDEKCRFIEEIHDNGYSRLRSIWKPELYLGFNGKGRYQNPLSYHMRPKCFDWIKSSRYIPEEELHQCDRPVMKRGPKLEHSSHPYEVFRKSFMKQFRVDEESNYLRKNEREREH